MARWGLYYPHLGTMEPWNLGTMEPWNHGTLETRFIRKLLFLLSNYLTLFID